MTQVLEIDVGAWLGHERPYVVQRNSSPCSIRGSPLGLIVSTSLFEPIPSEQRHAQLETGIAEIALRFDLDYKIFAFPYGEFGLTREFLESIEQEGLADMCFGTRGITVDELEPRLVLRMLAEGHKDSFDRI